MKKKMLKIVALMTAFIAVVTLNTVIYAQEGSEAPELYIDGYSVTEEKINIFVNQNQSDTSWINLDNSKVMFGSKELNTEEIKKFTDAPVKVTYKCVIDVSGSMSQERIDTAKEMIKALAYAKRSEDNVTVTAMANELIRSDYMTDPDQIAELVSKVQRTGEDTNLYYGIVEEIKELQTNDMVGEKKCLIIFSDGADDQATGITREEASKAVEKSHIPVFTVAMPKNSASKTDQEMAKILGSFARLSSGGEHYYTPEYPKDGLSQIGNRIVERLNNSLIFTEDIRELDTTEKAHELKITVKTAEGVAEDVIDVAESDVKRIKQLQDELEPEVTVSDSTVSEVDIEPVAAPEPGPRLIFGIEPLYFYLIVAAIILLIIFIVILVILKKNSNSEEEEGSDDMDQTSRVDDIGITGGVSDLNGVTLPLDDTNSPTMGFTSPGSNTKAFHVTLTRMGKTEDEKNVYRFDLTDRYSMGRSASKSQLSFPKDTALSGIHCTFYVQNKRIYLRDEKSTNGTFVNGVPITGPYALEKDDTLLIGSNEYRVTWK